MSTDLEKRMEVVEVEEKTGNFVGEPLERSSKSFQPIDEIRRDEAVQIIEDYIAAGGQQEWTEWEEKRLKRKIDWKLIPVVAVTMFFQLYDKNIMAQAV